MNTEQTPGQSSKAKGLLGTVLAGAIAVGAFILTHTTEHLSQMGGEWLGTAMFIPLVLVFLCCWIAGKLIPQTPDALRIAIGITSAQAIYHLLGGLLGGGAAMVAVAPDVLILGGGTAWLIARPGFWPIALLIGFEAIALAMNVFMVFEVGFEVLLVKGLISMLLIRVAAIIMLYYGWKAIRPSAPAVAKDGVAAG
jgi:hypothetical protein